MKTTRNGMSVFSRVLGFAAIVGLAGTFLSACAPEPVMTPPADDEMEEAPAPFPADPEPTIPPAGPGEPYDDFEGLELGVPDAPDPIWPEETE